MSSERGSALAQAAPGVASSIVTGTRPLAAPWATLPAHGPVLAARLGSYLWLAFTGANLSFNFDPQGRKIWTVSVKEKAKSEAKSLTRVSPWWGWLFASRFCSATIPGLVPLGFSHLDLMFANIIGNIMLYVQMSV